MENVKYIKYMSSIYMTTGIPPKSLLLFPPWTKHCLKRNTKHLTLASCSLLRRPTKFLFPVYLCHRTLETYDFPS